MTCSASFLSASIIHEKYFLPLGLDLEVGILVRAEAEVAAARAVVPRVDPGPGASSCHKGRSAGTL